SLRQDDAPHGLASAHADRFGGIHLAALDREDAAPAYLAEISERMQTEPDGDRGEGRKLNSGQDRQRVIDPNQLYKRRSAAKCLHVEGRQRSKAAVPGEPRESDQ